MSLTRAPSSSRRLPLRQLWIPQLCNGSLARLHLPCWCSVLGMSLGIPLKETKEPRDSLEGNHREWLKWWSFQLIPLSNQEANHQLHKSLCSFTGVTRKTFAPFLRRPFFPKRTHTPIRICCKDPRVKGEPSGSMTKYGCQSKKRAVKKTIRFGCK